MLPLPIERDKSRFKRIVRGKIREDIRKHISNKELIGKRGKEVVSIPIPTITIPQIVFGKPGTGVGQGEGKIGDPIGSGDQDGEGSKAGDRPGQHIREVEITLEELAEILGEELELPRIQPKEKNNVEGTVTKYTGARRVGPETLRYFKKTYKRALQRMIMEDTYDPKNPVIIPISDDKFYRSWKEYPSPQTNAVIFYLMDVSGSMSDQKKELVRLTAFWINAWLNLNYRNLINKYIVHDAVAYLVDEETFYSTRESGGTKISSAYKLLHKVIDKEYPPCNWNIYAYHFSDGENWGSGDDKKCIELLTKNLLPNLNMFCYGQVKHSWGKAFTKTLEEITEFDNIVSVPINGNDDIYTAIKEFLKKGL